VRIKSGKTLHFISYSEIRQYVFEQHTTTTFVTTGPSSGRSMPAYVFRISGPGYRWSGPISRARDDVKDLVNAFGEIQQIPGLGDTSGS
jgi:hypothetical protein